MSLIIKEIAVGITEDIREALTKAAAFSGIKAGQYARIALTEKLVRDGFMEHPGKSASKIQETGRLKTAYRSKKLTPLLEKALKKEAKDCGCGEHELMEYLIECELRSRGNPVLRDQPK